MNEVEQLIRGYGGFITTEQAKKAGRDNYRLMLKMAEDGQVLRIRSGVYVLPDSLADIMIDVDKVVPGGTVCLYSAWLHFGLSTQVPGQYDIAVPRGKVYRLAEYPPIALHQWEEKTIGIGRVREKIGSFDVPIYDVERCVCDAVKFRNKIGIDVSAEVFRSYIGRQSKNLSRLIEYADALRVGTTIRKYMEAWL